MFGIGTLVVVEQSTLEKRPRGVCGIHRRVWYTPTRLPVVVAHGGNPLQHGIPGLLRLEQRRQQRHLHLSHCGHRLGRKQAQQQQRQEQHDKPEQPQPQQ